MGSLDNNSSDRLNSQENTPAGNRYIISREDPLEVPREEHIMMRKDDLARIESQHEQELARLEEKYRRELAQLKEQHQQDIQQIRGQIRKDLAQIARRIEADLRQRAGYLQGLAGTLFGIAIGIAGAIPQLLTAPTLSNWVTPTYAVSAASLSLLSIVFILIDHSLRDAHKENVRSIRRDIGDLLEKEPVYQVKPVGSSAE